MNKPYRISGLLGVDSYPTHAAAAVIWTLSSVFPLFHVDWAISLSLSVEHFGSGKTTQEPLLQRGKGVAHHRRVSCAFFSILLVPCFRRARALVSGWSQG